MGVASKIGEIAKERKISLKELSRIVDIPYTTLYHSVKRDSKMDFETVQRIAAALNIPWSELFSANASDPDVREFAPSSENQKEKYNQRVDTASAYLFSLQCSAEEESGFEWSDDSRNDWMKRHLKGVAEKFNIEESDLDDSLCWRHPDAENYLDAIQDAVEGQPIRFKKLAKICRMLVKMNSDGQAVAADRVEELAQIPKYQKAAGGNTQSVGEEPAGPDDKEPTEK